MKQANSNTTSNFRRDVKINNQKKEKRKAEKPWTLSLDRQGGKHRKSQTSKDDEACVTVWKADSGCSSNAVHFFLFLIIR